MNEKKNIIITSFFIVVLIFIGLIVISKEVEKIEQENTTEAIKTTNQANINNNEKEQENKDSTTASSKDSNQIEEENKEPEVLWEKEYQNNEIEILNNMYKSFSLTFNDIEIDKEDIELHNFRKEIYCKEEETSIDCLLSFLTVTGFSYFTYFSIADDGQLLGKRGYQAEGYHHSGAYTTEGIFNYIDNALYIVNISDSFGSPQEKMATTSVEVSILDSKLNLMNNFSFTVKDSLRIESCDSFFLNSYDPNKYLEGREEFTVVNDVLNLTCILTDYKSNESLYNIAIDIPSQTYSTTKQSI